MAFPTTGILDDFNRANSGTLGANWTSVVDNLGILSNQCYAPNNFAIDYYNVANYGPDCEGFFVMSVLPGDGAAVDLTARYDSVNVNGYTVQYLKQAGTGSDEVRIFRLDGGSFTQLGATIITGYSPGDSLGIEVSGSTITAYRKTSGTWSSVGSRTDTTYSAAGKLAITIEDGTARLDDFGGGTVVSASSRKFQRNSVLGV